MLHVLVVGYDPEAIDYTDPLVPEGVTKEKVAAGIQADMQKMSDLGWDAEHLNIWPDDTARDEIAKRLQAKTFDCLVVGGGVRVTARRVGVLEMVVNTMREMAPETPIAFNNGPDNSREAVSRVLKIA